MLRGATRTCGVGRFKTLVVSDDVLFMQSNKKGRQYCGEYATKQASGYTCEQLRLRLRRRCDERVKLQTMRVKILQGVCAKHSFLRVPLSLRRQLPSIR
jgi:hypothetical protein